MNVKFIRALLFVMLISYVLARSYHSQNRYGHNKEHLSNSDVKINDNDDDVPRKSYLKDYIQKNEKDEDSSSSSDDDDNSNSSSSSENDEDAEVDTNTDYNDDDTEDMEAEIETTTVKEEPTEQPIVGNDCEDIKTYINNKGLDADAIIMECTVNSNGKIDYLYYDDNSKLLSSEDIDYLYSFETLTYVIVYHKGNNESINKLANIPMLDKLRIFNTKGGTLDINSLNGLNISTLSLAAPSSKNIYVKEGAFKNFPSLKTLDLSQFCFLQDNIENISNLPNLEEINCDACGFRYIESYEPLKKLTKLHTLKFVSYNKYNSPILNIPIALTEITSLKILTLARQVLTSIPDELANLTNLEYLNLNNNDIVSIPESLNTLPHLKEVHFSGPIVGKVLTNESLEICSYYIKDSLCKTKDMDCLGEDNLLIKYCE